MIVDELIAVLGYRLQGQDNLRRFESGLDHAGARAQVFSTRIAGVATKLAGFATAAAAAGAAVGGAFAVGLSKKVLDVGGTFESLRAQLKTAFEGNEDASRKAFDQIQQYAQETSFSLQNVTEAFVRLKNYGFDPFQNNQLQLYGDTAAALGKNIIQVVEAIADVSMGQYDRLPELGVKAAKGGGMVELAWVEAGKTIKKTVKDIPEEVLPVLYGVWKRYTGAAIEQSKTWKGLLNNLGDAWEKFLDRIFTSGFGDYMKSQLKGFMDWLDTHERDITRIAESISRAFVTVAKSAVGWMTYFTQRWNVFKPVLAGVGLAILGIVSYVSPVTAAVISLSAAIAAAIAAFKMLAHEKGMMQVPSGEWVIKPPELQTDWATVITDNITRQLDKATLNVSQWGDRIAGIVEKDGIDGLIEGVDAWSEQDNIGRVIAAAGRFFNSLYEEIKKIVKAITWSDIGWYLLDQITGVFENTPMARIFGGDKAKQRAAEAARTKPSDAVFKQRYGDYSGSEDVEVKPALPVEPALPPEDPFDSERRDPSLFPAEPTIQTNDNPLSLNVPKLDYDKMPELAYGKPPVVPFGKMPVAKFQPPPQWSRWFGGSAGRGGNVNASFGGVSINQQITQAMDAPGEAARAMADAITKQMRTALRVETAIG